MLSVLIEIQFLTFSLTHRGRGVARWDQPHVIQRVKLCLYAKFCACSSIFGGAKLPFLTIFNTEMGVAI